MARSRDAMSVVSLLISDPPISFSALCTGSCSVPPAGLPLASLGARHYVSGHRIPGTADQLEHGLSSPHGACLRLFSSGLPWLIYNPANYPLDRFSIWSYIRSCQEQHRTPETACATPVLRHCCCMGSLCWRHRHLDDYRTLLWLAAGRFWLA